MKREQISEAISHINPDYIDEAFAYRETAKAAPNTNRKQWIAIAACLVVIPIAGTLLLPTLKKALSFTPSDSTYSDALNENEIVNSGSTSIGGIPRNYKAFTTSAESTAMIWPWEYMMPCEKYTSVIFQNRRYDTRGRSISNALLGEIIGTCHAEAVDIYTDKQYSDTFSVRAITGISEERLIAVEMYGESYVYIIDDSNQPSTLGEMLDMYSLQQTLRLDRFTQCESYNDIAYYRLEEDTPIWQILSECRDAVVVDNNDQWSFSDKSYLSFTATSEALGIYKLTFSITKDGYLWTNLSRYSSVYHIGEQAADTIFRYASEHAVPAQFEPYTFSLAGTIAKINADSLVLDDTVLCADESEGMLFTILTEDIRMRRCLECMDFSVGDTVVIKFTDEILSADGAAINNAYEIMKCRILDDTIAVPE